MSSWQIITGILIVSLLCISAFFLLKEMKARKKIPYEKLFGNKEKRKVYLTKNNHFIGWLVLIFFLSIFSFIFLLRITLISTPALLFAIILLAGANVLILRKKYKIKSNHDIAWLTLIIVMGQFSFFLWLNFIPKGKHLEEYQITKFEKDGTGFTTITLLNDAYDDYWTLRSFEGRNVPHGDTIVYEFTDGMLGFKIYRDHTAH